MTALASFHFESTDSSIGFCVSIYIALLGNGIHEFRFKRVRSSTIFTCPLTLTHPIPFIHSSHFPQQLAFTLPATAIISARVTAYDLQDPQTSMKATSMVSLTDGKVQISVFDRVLSSGRTIRQKKFIRAVKVSVSSQGVQSPVRFHPRYRTSTHAPHRSASLFYCRL